MCGIVGFINQENNKEEIIKKMALRIIHRGPDDEGYYVDDDIALGHRRLSIVDVENGKQPMLSADNKNVIIFNGEIYNFKQLRAELIEKGYQLTTQTDTEVILVGYQHWKEDVVKKLRGMFAFVIWDNEKKSLFCARDTFGIKPFYYYQKEQVFMFASEIKCFLEHPQFQKECNKELLAPYLSFSFTPTAKTFFKDVYCLEPGSMLIYSQNQIHIKKYKQIQFIHEKQDFQSTVYKTQEIMKDSIQSHLTGDQEIGAFLSGGIDSSYLVSLFKPQKTYTVGYLQKDYSEIQYAQDTAKKLKIENNHHILTKEELMQAVYPVLYHLDEPLADPSVISLYYLAKLASQDVKVVISGEGADEFFGGYNYYKSVVQYQCFKKIPLAIRCILTSFLKRLPEMKGRQFLMRVLTNIEDEYIGVNKIWSEKERKKVLCCKETIKDRKITQKVFEQYKDEDDLAKMQAVDIHFWLLKDILLKCDKMTMAHSLEARTPYVDQCVFQLASSLPMEYKVTQKQTKVILREASKSVIPNQSYNKKKLGFPVPLREWMKEDDVYHEILKTFRQDYVQQFFNQDYLIHLLNQHRSSKKDHYRKIWSVYMFLKWYEIYFIKG